MSSSAPGGGFRQHAGLGGAVAHGGYDGARVKGNRRAHDGADIVRIGDLIEHEQERAVFQRFQPANGEGARFQHDALMDRLGPEDLVDIVRHHDLDRKAERIRVEIEPRQSVLRHR